MTEKATYCLGALESQMVSLKGGDPATPSGTATLLRLSPSYLFYPNWLL